MTRKTETIEHLDASIARWKSRLKRSVTMLDKLEKKRRRIAAKATVASVIDPLIEALKPEPKVPASTLVAAVKGHIARVTPSLNPVKGDDSNLDIPEFLRRGDAAQKAADAVIADQIRQEQATTKVAKARGRIATMKAKKAGETRKMPVSGKAALDLIRNG